MKRTRNKNKETCSARTRCTQRGLRRANGARSLTGSDRRGDASEADGWSLVSLVEALEGRAFDAVPTDTEERVVFALKYADETMASPRSSTRATRSTR